MRRKIIAFDLDDTLAITKSPMSDEMSILLKDLLGKYEVCIISGGKFDQFKIQVIDRLPSNTQNLEKLHIMPTCGTRYYCYENGNWKMQYSEDLSTEEKEKVIRVLTEQAKALKVWQEKTWGEIIEDRESQITYSALGQQAPPEEKYRWAAKNQELKHTLRDYVAERLPELEVRLGGSTSLDITKPGIDKAYGMKKLLEKTGYTKEDILFIGDKLEEGGNDYPVKAFGIDCIAVKRWEDTAYVIKGILGASQ